MEINNLENTVYEYKYSLAEPLLQNNRKTEQECKLFPGSKFVCDWQRDEKDYTIQVIFPLTPNKNYNHYAILIYHWISKRLYLIGYRSHTLYPPVWDRYLSCGPDYLDYIKIQDHINYFLTSKNIQPFIKDESFIGKSWNGTKESHEEIEALLDSGKSYNILSLKAEVMAEELKKNNLICY